MLTSSARAVFILSSSRVLPLLTAANVSVVSVLEPPSAQPEADAALHRVTEYVVGEVRRRLASESTLDSCEAAIKWVRDVATAGGQDQSSCYIHAEAGAMALVCDARSRLEVSEP